MDRGQDSGGRVAVVTGAAHGIGRAVAERLATSGTVVAVADVDGEGARATVAAVEAAGGRATAHVVDLAVRDQRAALVPAVIGDHGRVDVLVNNAATLGARHDLFALDEDDWATVIATNLTATAFLSRDAGRDMATRGAGVIVNLASLHAQLPLPRHVAYAASKGGISALTRALAVELAPHGVRVNAVVPGMVGSEALLTEIDDVSGGSPAAAEPSTLVGRLGRPEEIASAVAYLTSDEAAFVTGALWQVDGGRAISRKPDPLSPL